jgi:hypothetical protein
MAIPCLSSRWAQTLAFQRLHLICSIQLLSFLHHPLKAFHIRLKPREKFWLQLVRHGGSSLAASCMQLGFLPRDPFSVSRYRFLDLRTHLSGVAGCCAVFGGSSFLSQGVASRGLGLPSSWRRPFFLVPRPVAFFGFRVQFLLCLICQSIVGKVFMSTVEVYHGILPDRLECGKCVILLLSALTCYHVEHSLDQSDSIEIIALLHRNLT